MRCGICGREKDVSELSRGIYENKVVNVCGVCANLEDIPIMNRPTEEQLKRATQRYTVRETMERISGFNRARELSGLSGDQTVANKNLAKIRFPEKVQETGNLIENYYWILRMARRRKKLSLMQLSEITKIHVRDLENLERGVLPKGYENMISAIENALGVNLLKNPDKRVNFTAPKKITERPKGDEWQEEADSFNSEQRLHKREAIEGIKKGDFDFSRRKKLDSLTINDLAELKKERDKMKQEGDFGKIPRKEPFGNKMTGDDIEFDED